MYVKKPVFNYHFIRKYTLFYFLAAYKFHGTLFIGTLFMVLYHGTNHGTLFIVDNSILPILIFQRNASP